MCTSESGQEFGHGSPVHPRNPASKEKQDTMLAEDGSRSLGSTHPSRAD